MWLSVKDGSELDIRSKIIAAVAVYLMTARIIRHEDTVSAKLDAVGRTT